MHLVAPLIHSHFKLFDAQFRRFYFPPRSASVPFYLDGPGHLLTVILAPGGADTDCQRDVSFLLFISSLPERCLRTQVSLFSPEGEGGGGGTVLEKTEGGVGVEGRGCGQTCYVGRSRVVPRHRIIHKSGILYSFISDFLCSDTATDSADGCLCMWCMSKQAFTVSMTNRGASL